MTEEAPAATVFPLDEHPVCWLCSRRVTLRPDGTIQRHAVPQRRSRAVLVLGDASGRREVVTVVPGLTCPASGRPGRTTRPVGAEK
jgi:hypothetical protein